MFKIGDRVRPTSECYKRWPNNDYGSRMGTIEERIFDKYFMVRWDNAPVRCYYDPKLLAPLKIQLENK